MHSNFAIYSVQKTFDSVQQAFCSVILFPAAAFRSEQQVSVAAQQVSVAAQQLSF